tara:strand:+ start:2651 stop:3799 length:1149 start_codon:yes stop_codon:yes gene_type:complete
MNFKSLLDKIIDKGKLVLTQPTMLFIDKEDIGIDGEHVVDADEVGRIDLIALEHYNSEEHIDYLLKFNGISDPLGINEGDILKIPSLGPNYKKLERPVTAVDNIVRQEFVDGKRLTKKDKRRSDFLKKKYKIKEVLPPNMLKSGFKTFKFTEKNGEKATEMGMGAMTPDRTYKPKSTSSTAKSLGNVGDDSWKKVDSQILDKDMENLTLKDVNTLAKAGITLETFESAKEEKKKNDKKQKADKNNGKTSALGDPESSSKEIFENGEFIGVESTVKTSVIDSGKKSTTITKTLVRPDGSSTSTQVQELGEATPEEIMAAEEENSKAQKAEYIKKIADLKNEKSSLEEKQAKLEKTQASLERQLRDSKMFNRMLMKNFYRGGSK